MKFKIIKILVVAILSIYCLLLIPDNDNGYNKNSISEPFVWNKDRFWNELEKQFQQVNISTKSSNDSAFNKLKIKAEQMLITFELEENVPLNNIDTILFNFFKLASFIAVDTAEFNWYNNYYVTFRKALKVKSKKFDLNKKEVRDILYKTNYGMRAALEEVKLQQKHISYDSMTFFDNTPSETTETNLLGMKIRSGDLLVSRGGAEVSALIARGNDYSGNFSHVAIAYIDEKTNKTYFIESHIEKGVAIATKEQYLNDKKLRLMVLRLDYNLPAIKKNSLLPHQAAKFAFEEVQKRHIPYDFKMNYKDHNSMFCSELAYYAYEKYNIHLWQFVSTISSDGVKNMLNTFGVENFVTQMPSDLEYDPKLLVVAEWTSAKTLFKDHLDNAVIDIMLENANNGKVLTYNIFMLPFARILKAYCWVLNQFDKVGIIPEGMSATQALKSETFETEHQKIKEETNKLVQQFIKKNGYNPPYWQLVNLAKKASKSNN